MKPATPSKSSGRKSRIDSSLARSPFPDDPAGGEFAWAISLSGTTDVAALAVDPTGNIVVAATQLDEVVLGNLRIPRPTTGTALLVLKLTPHGEPIWGRSFSATAVSASAVATSPDGAIVIGGQFRGSELRFGDHTLVNAGDWDGFAVVLESDDGAPRWSTALATDREDRVTGVAAGQDESGATAIYLYGDLSRNLERDAYLSRHDGDGAQRWAHRFAPLAAHAMALDPARGPVILGSFEGDLVLGNEVLTNGLGDSVVAGFAPDGQVRFARRIFTAHRASFQTLAVAPRGDVYVFSEANAGTTIVDDRVISNPGGRSWVLVLRLTHEGRHAFSTLVAGDPRPQPHTAAVDATGAAYMVTRCSGRMYVQPEIACGGTWTEAMFSYDASNEYRWATYVKNARVDAMVAAPGNRMIVAGAKVSEGDVDVDLGGVRVPIRTMVIAAIAGGPARPPSPLPEPPAISSVQLAGIGDTEIRQGGTATLVIRGSGLDRVTSARLGDIDIHVPPAATSPTRRS